ncbi:MAG: response regulator transcription factor [Bacteroidales bacterium]
MQNKERILLVEDDVNFGSVLKSYLQLNDYEVVLKTDGNQGLSAFIKEHFSLCILDVMLPFLDGFELAKEITKINPEIPFVFLTSKTLKEDVLQGYQLGAYDYITKPFDTDVFLYKIKAIFKAQNHFLNNKIAEQQEFIIGNYLFKYKLREVFDGERIYNLTPKEAELLRLLFMHRDNLLPRELALKTIWGDDNYFTTRSMDVYITKLRKIFKNDDSIEIMNLHGNGFRLLER